LEEFAIFIFDVYYIKVRAKFFLTARERERLSMCQIIVKKFYHLERAHYGF